jgi:putative endonuclease
MSFHIYIIQNPEGKIYIGQTNDLDRRLRQHNDQGYRGTVHTKRHEGPWRIIHSENYETRSDAMKREKQLKSGKGRDWIKKQLLLN